MGPASILNPLHLPLLLLLLLLLCGPPVTAQVDRTREVGGQGSSMVEAVLAEVHDACVYPEDQGLLRRIAFVETRDGTNPSTYSTPGYDGGIWKVDQAMFQRTQRESTRLSQQYVLIRSKLGIDWFTVTWADMRRPLYSALAAAMYLGLEGAPGNVPSSVDQQASYWLQHYRQGHATQTVQNFTSAVNTLQKTCARTENVDVVFLVDTSSSVGPSEWTSLKQFVADIVISMSLHNGLAPHKDRVAMLTFSDRAQVSFGFDQGTDLRTTLIHISNSPMVRGATNFSSVLTTVYTQVLNTARADAAKIAVLVTDGKDNDRQGVVLALMPLKLSDVTIFTVGIGSQVDDDQLAQMSSAPACSHTFHVASHNDLADLHMAIERISCRVPVVLGPGVYNYPCGFNVLAQLKGGSLGTSITVSADYGSVDVFGSYTTQLPSDNVYDLKETANSSTPAVIYARDPRPLTFSLQSERSQALLCNGHFTVRVDNQAAKRTDCNKKNPDLAFLLDTSLAGTDAQWTAMLSFVEAFVQRFDVTSAGAQVALVSFAGTPTSHFQLGQYGSNADLLQALRAIPRPGSSGSSNLPSALEFIHDQVFSGSRSNSSRTLVIVSPGTRNDFAQSLPQASVLHSMGVRIVIAAVGSSFDDVNLNVITSGPQHLQKVADVSALTSSVGDVVKEACGEVNVLCMENGISRPCHIEDLVSSQYGNMLDSDRYVGFNPCALQFATSSIHIERFPHPSKADKFLLCDSSGQMYVVLCPVGQLYDPMRHECHVQGSGLTTAPSAPTTTSFPITYPPVTVSPVTTSSPGGHQQFSNPCTPDMVVKGLLFHAYPADNTKYFHCGATPYTGQLETCPVGKVWYQAITQCVFTGVIVDPNTNQVDHSLPNPCTGGAAYFPGLASDPNTFIQCNSYHEAYLMHCPTGEVWNNVQQACDYHAGP